MKKSFILRKGCLLSLGLLGLLAIFAATARAQSPCLLTDFKQAPTFPIGNAPQAMAADDFDGDGRADIAATNNGVNVSVLRNTSGAGSGNFAPKVDLSTPAGASAIAVADFDADGKKDIVVTSNNNAQISVLRNTGAGTGTIGFAAAVTFAVTPSRAVAVGDFNGDGKPDVAVPNNTQNNVAVLINTTAAAGTISFAAPVTFAVGIQPVAVEVADIDGDGKADIVTSNTGSIAANTVSILRNTSAAAVSFAPKVDLIIGQFFGSSPISLVLADLNGDNKPDIATANTEPNNVSVLRNTSSGSGSITFAAKVDFGVGFRPNKVTAGDFDGDGKTDLAAANLFGNTVSVLRNNGAPGALGFEIRKDFGIGRKPASVAAADFDGDGKIDLAATNSESHNVSFLQNRRLNTGDLRFDARPEIVLGPVFGINPKSIAADDLDGDGKKDLVTANYVDTISVLRNSSINAGSVKFSQNVEFPTVAGGNPEWVEIEDFDGDGKKDVVVANQTLNSVSVLRNTTASPGAISFAPKVDFPVNGTKPLHVAAADFDNDGRYDLVLANRESNNISVLRNTSAGVGNISFSEPQVLASGGGPTFLTVTDLDADGLTDVVVTNFFSPNISVFRNSSTGAGVVSFAPKVDIAVNTNPFAITSGDFDGDGKKDLAVTNLLNSNGIVSILRNTSSGAGVVSFAAKVDFTIPMPDITTVPAQIVAGDVDNNGKLDLVFINIAYSAASIMRNTSPGAGTIGFAPRTDETIGISPASLVVDDFDRDGKSEIVYASYNSNYVGILQNPCSVFWKGAADFDGDLKTDVSIFRPSVGEWWINRSSTGATVAAQFGASADKAVPADYTGDGRADIAFWRPSTGEWFVLRSEDGSYFSFPFGTDGDVPVPADFDGDEITDIAVFRPSTSEWYILRSTGGTAITTFGAAGDTPVAADYDGDRKADLAIFRPSDGSWWYVRSSDNQYRVYAFGLGTDKPVPGDWTGDGKADIAVWRPTTGEWFFQRSEDNSYYSLPFGAPGDIAAPGDYDGDGRFDTAVFRPGTANWFVQRSTAGILITSFGASGDRPLPGVLVP